MALYEVLEDGTPRKVAGSLKDYTAGNGISIENGVISADDTELRGLIDDKLSLTGGTLSGNLTISGSGDVPLEIKSGINGSGVYINFKNKDGTSVGMLGVSLLGRPRYINGSTIGEVAFTSDIPKAGNGISIENGAISSNFLLELVWTNSSSRTAFAGQTIYKDFSKYNMALVLYRIARTDGYISTAIVPKGYAGFMGEQYLGASRYIRLIEGFEDSYITFGNGIVATSINNDSCIPHAIYGIRVG